MEGNDGRRQRFMMAMLSALLGVVFIASFFIGRFKVSLFSVPCILLDRLINLISFGKMGLPVFWTSQEFSVVVNIRLPRIASAALIGAALSASGASYQGIFRNPLVSPDILGASAGAGFGAALGILLGFSYALTTLSSFLFGLGAVLLAYAVSKASRIQTSLAMVLAGVMVGSLFSSATSFVKLVADTENQLPAITYWLMGSLSSVKKSDALFALLVVAIGLVPLLLLRWRINLLTVSEAEARSMGLETDRLRLIVVVAATLMTSASVAVAGIIGWVGLVVPHFARLIFGPDYRKLLPSSALLGAVFLMVVDDLARVATSSEIPIGILTAFIGTPVFLHLMLKGGDDRAS